MDPNHDMDKVCEAGERDEEQRPSEAKATATNRAREASNSHILMYRIAKRPHKDDIPLDVAFPGIKDEMIHTNSFVDANIATVVEHKNACFPCRRFESSHYPDANGIVAVFKVSHSSADGACNMRLLNTNRVTMVAIVVADSIVWQSHGSVITVTGIIPLALLRYNEVSVVAFTSYQSRNELYDANLTLQFDAVLIHDTSALQRLMDSRISIPEYNFTCMGSCIVDFN